MGILLLGNWNLTQFLIEFKKKQQGKTKRNKPQQVKLVESSQNDDFHALFDKAFCDSLRRLSSRNRAPSFVQI